MGGEYQGWTETAKDLEELRKKYQAHCDRLVTEYGTRPYSGTFKEKQPGLELIVGEWDIHDAEKHCLEYNDKWQQAQAYHLGGNEWYVGGWCSC